MTVKVNTIRWLQPSGQKYRILTIHSKVHGGPFEFTFAAFDEDGRAISGVNDVCLKVGYNEKGEIVEFGVSPDYPLIERRNSDPATIEANGKKYTLGVTNKRYRALRQRVQLNLMSLEVLH